MLKIAEEGFQHLEQPQAWLWEMFEVRETVTGEVLQWQWRVPPENEEEPGVMPALMRGCKLKDIVDLVVIEYFFRGCSFRSREEGFERKEWMEL
jgi:hypothetical protein